jgi:hypothetical protein
MEAGDFADLNMLAKGITVSESASLHDVSVGGNLTYENTYYDDLFVPLTTTRVGSNAKPDFDFTNVGYLFPKNDATEILYFIVQLPHRWKTGTTIYPHVHWRQTANETPVFKLDYKWYSIGATVPANFVTLTISTKVVTYSTGTIHQISNSTTGISGEGKGISSILVCKLYRDDNQGAGDVLVDQFDIHHEIDAPGSREEYSK